MSLYANFIGLLKEHKLWVSTQGIAPDFDITGKPVTDSRLIQPGDVFICIRGYLSDGHQFISKAREWGAGLIIQEDEFSNEQVDKYPAIRVTCARKAAALLARLYFDNPTGKLCLVGVTGTNGKTTTSMLLWQALTNLGHKTGWIGTLGYRIGDEIIPTNNTTPDIMELNGIFKLMVDAGCLYVVMEVSSHALALDRVYGLEYDLAMFTNLSRDHLDFHKDMSDYADSKFKLFEYTRQNQGKCLIYTDDEFGKEIYDRLDSMPQENRISVSETTGDYLISGINCTLQGSKLHVSTAGENIEIATNLIGHFNVLNTGMVFAALRALLPALTPIELQKVFGSLQPVQGRLEKVHNNRGIGVYVDYAHTPDALKSVLEAVSELPHHRILVMFGAGGNRDKGKRPEMLQQALLKADATIVTDDNPRNENPAQIIREITEDADLWASWWIIRDRKVAIESILRLAQPGDIVLLAGKGHETYQEIEGIRHHFDDVEVALNVLNRADENQHTDDGLILPIDPLLLEALLKAPFVEGTLTPDRTQQTNEDAKENGVSSSFATSRCFTRISTDSRSITSGSLYIAITGVRFDGMDYVSGVLKDSTCAAIINKSAPELKNTITFPDTQKALGLIARKYLKMFGAYRIALTGSTGKTTTKEVLANIFSCSGKTLRTSANENNVIGLSKTIFRIKPEDKTAIFELGTNHFGEIALLADICEPQVGLITNVGPSHLEFLIDEEGVYFEKTALFRRKLEFLVFPGDDPRFEEYFPKGISVGYTEKCHFQITDVRKPHSDREAITAVLPEGLCFTMAGHIWQTSVTAPFYIDNIALAVALALNAGLHVELIQKGILSSSTANLRLEMRKYGKRLVIWDCYNANPTSLKAALGFWKEYQPDKPHIAILGSMLELGANTVLYHKEIGSLLSTLSFDKLFTVGELAEYYQPFCAESNQNDDDLLPDGYSKSDSKHFNGVEALIGSDFMTLIPQDSIILIKASHGIHLEKLMTVFENEAIPVVSDIHSALSKE